ncbi:MAG: glycosyltransferase family 39 protein, partial [Candidatus Hydrogenedentes bacterium]|nr:glycosyltransferase family 39 protein [Candidatus Hydrogenedentota bacterium]
MAGRREGKARGTKKKASGLRADVLICMGLLMVTAVAYSYAPHLSFVNFDDDVYVARNPQVLGGLRAEGVAWAFTTNHASNWHPLTWMSHMVDADLFGVQPAGPHVVNVLLHMANAVLLYIVLRAMTGAVWQAAFVAVLFAVHPLHVESVAWVSERKDVLSTLFWMLTSLAYVRYVRKPGVGRYVLVAVCFALGLMAKPMVVTLPFAFLLLDFWPLNRVESESLFSMETVRSYGRLVWEKVPLFALTGACAAATFFVQGSTGAVRSLDQIPLG